MKIFTLLLITTLILFAIPVGILGLINRIRDRQLAALVATIALFTRVKK